MHVFFSGIGGMGIGPLSLIAHQAGYQVSGSDKQDNAYIHYLRSKGLSSIYLGQTYDQIAQTHRQTPIDWYVYSSAVTKEQADAPELRFCQEHGIRTSKRDEFLSEFLTQQNLKLIAIAGTHGKSTTTAMVIWLFKQLKIPVSYSVGAKLHFGDMGQFDPNGQYFVYEADEYDKNFLAFHPHLSLITGLDWDHPDIYPTQESYNQAFQQFLAQSQRAVMWDEDQKRLGLENGEHLTVLAADDAQIDQRVTLPGHVNRLNGWQVVQSVSQMFPDRPLGELLAAMNQFPGLARRFELIAPHIYSDYAHTPPKIRGALQLAREVAGDSVVVIYEGLHNTRQHFIKEELHDLLNGLKALYIVPSYLAREDPSLPLLSPQDLIKLLSPEAQAYAHPAQLDDGLQTAIQTHARAGDTVLCLTAGGGGSLDEWLRRTFAPLGH